VIVNIVILGGIDMSFKDYLEIDEPGLEIIFLPIFIFLLVCTIPICGLLLLIEEKTVSTD
jgi:hypothetical protein